MGALNTLSAVEAARQIAASGDTTLEFRRTLAAKVYARTAAYDAAIAGWMAGHRFGGAGTGAADATSPFPAQVSLRLELVGELRYGENPHQRGAVYVDPQAAGPSVVRARILHGKPLSYNNLLDAGAALELVQDLALQRAGGTGTTRPRNERRQHFKGPCVTRRGKPEAVPRPHCRRQCD